MELIEQNSNWLMKYKVFFVFLVITLSGINFSFSQGLTCDTIEPFCAGDTTLIFPNNTVGTAEVGPDYGCLGSQPAPSWYFIQIDTPGDLNFSIVQNTQADLSGTGIDVDFIAYGPFTNTNVCNQLTAANTIACSFSPNFIENFTITGALAGEIYVLLITNYSPTPPSTPGFIQLQQTNAGDPGGGETDCSIVNTTNHCVGDVISLDATTANAVLYEWFQDGILLPETGPILNNVVAPSSVYTTNAYDSFNNVILDYEFIVEFHEVPIVAAVNNLLQCDDNNDGFFNFDLSVNDALILGAQDVSQFSITYHESQANADSGTSVLALPFTNTSNPQTIFARIENNDNTDCFDTISFTLEVFDTPTANVADDLLQCDDNNDGFFVFDLSLNDAFILDTQDALQFTITYHDSQANADSGTSVLALPFTNTSNPQTIFARIENNDNTDCFDTISFTLEVFDTPTANVSDNLFQCDDNNDGFFDFDLSVNDALILGTQDVTQFSITYHQTQTEADINTNALSSPYTNQVAYQEEEIFVRIENNFNTNCFDTSSFLINVFDVPTANSVVDFESCDNDNDGDDTNGIITFDLSTKINEVLGTQLITDFEVKFYFTQADADAALLGTEIAMPIQNTSNPQLIVARIENILKVDCYDTTTFNLIIFELPEVLPLVELFQCDDDTDGFTEFNLTESNQLISTNYLNETFTYHTLLTDAENGLNAILNEITYVNIDSSATPDILYVRIENANGCYRTSQLNLLVSTTQIPANFQLSYEVCDDTLVDGDDRNGIAAFDFIDADAQITSLFPMGQILTITYYETLGDALQETNAIADISNHRNDLSPDVQSIFVRVDSDIDNACLGLGAHITLTVNPLPIINLDDEYLLCVNTNGTETVNIPILDTGLSIVDYAFEWSLDNTVLVGNTGSSLIPLQGGMYGVLVTNIATGCENTDTTIVNESEPPTITVVLTSLAFSENQIIEATAVGSGVYEYSLNGGPWQTSGVFVNVPAGEHIVTARDINGCGNNSATIIVIGYPKFFTPNGDGYHDTWNIVGIENQPNAKIYIFDRYGKLLKQITPMGNGWNGTYNGNRLPTSDYWFTVEYDEPSNGTRKQFKAHFSLKR
ncbi:T9SS type B sorting domain-containing protein [Olleya sp. AH-315-F22]|nr:T9SS type B sorting domain-containing protein [Olleya sp. AH-315-F22]